MIKGFAANLAELRTRVAVGMPVGHPEWCTGRLSPGEEELLDQIDAAEGLTGLAVVVVHQHEAGQR